MFRSSQDGMYSLPFNLLFYIRPPFPLIQPHPVVTGSQSSASSASSLVQLFMLLLLPAALLHEPSSPFLPFLSFRKQLGFLEKVPLSDQVPECLLVTILLLYKYLYWKLLVLPTRILRKEVLFYLFLCISSSET